MDRFPPDPVSGGVLASRVSALLAACALVTSGLRADEGEGAVEREGWVLTFYDDFEGDRLDYEKWTPRDPWEVVRNEELQGYWIKAFRVEGGLLRIRCEDEPTFYDGARRDFRSGMMTTSGKFSQAFGRFEIRCRVPSGRGLWPAFWLLPDPPSWPPEIDVMELLGEQPDTVYFSHHWRDPGESRDESLSLTKEFRGPDFSEMFHLFAIEWDEEEIRWYVDGILRYRASEKVPQVAMFLLVNLAVGGWAEEPDESTPFPSEFFIDWVRVWKREG